MTGLHLKPRSLIVTRVTAATVTTATLAKTFVPFYLIGSTAIFAATSAVGIALAAIDWRQLCATARRIPDFLAVLIALYGLLIANFLTHSRGAVPITHLIGILVFHSMFLTFGLSAARSLQAVLLVLLAAGAIYLIVIAQYVVRFGDLMREGVLRDVFGVGQWDIYVTFHQNIGVVLGIAALAALGLNSNRTMRRLAFAALPLVLLFMFHIAARGALVALVCSLLFLSAAASWSRSRKLTLLGAAAAVIVLALASSWFYQRALQQKDMDPKAGDAISRTIQEIQDPRPGFRMQIWTRTAQSILAEPERLLFGRGIGMFPVKDGFGAPDWLLRKTEGAKHFPHNVYLEILYEAGIAGLLLFSVLTLFPLAASLKRWRLFSWTEKSTMAIYVFSLTSSQLSGSFAYSYDLQFFLGLAIGIVARKRDEDGVAANQPQ